MSFAKATTLDELWIGEKLGVVVAGRPVLLVNVEGTVCAYEDRCRHKGVALSLGKLEGTSSPAAVHGWVYDACTGAGINPESAQACPISRANRRQRHLRRRQRRSKAMATRRDAGERRRSGSDPRAGTPKPWLPPSASSTKHAEIDRSRRLPPGHGPHSCTVTRQAIEKHAGEPFVFPSDLEMIMPSFKGRLSLTEDVAEWYFGGGGSR